MYVHMHGSEIVEEGYGNHSGRSQSLVKDSSGRCLGQSMGIHLQTICSALQLGSSEEGFALENEMEIQFEVR